VKLHFDQSFFKMEFFYRLRRTGY